MGRWCRPRPGKSLRGPSTVCIDIYIPQHMTSVYEAMATIEQRRCDEDILRRVILDNGEHAKLKRICGIFIDKLRETFPNPSTRLDRIWTECATTDDRITLHGFLFFCLRKHKWAVEHILADSGAPPEKISRFVLEILPDLTTKLLRGSFTSLRCFVEDARWQYCMI